MKQFRHSGYRLTPVLLIGLALAGCGSSDEENSGGGNSGGSGGGGGSTVQATYSSLWDSTFSSCGVNCHEPGAADGTESGPDMSSKSSFYANLVGKTVNGDFPAWANVKNGNCNDIPFIKPGDAANSTVVTSLIESYSINQTSCVSSFNLHLANNIEIKDSAVQDALVTWINSGAANN